MRGVVAASAGNHAQGVAFAARELGMTRDDLYACKGVTLPKLQATRNYGAEVQLVGENVRRVSCCRNRVCGRNWRAVCAPV